MKTISMIGLINNVYNEFNIPERIKINYGYYEETFKWDKNEKWFVTLDDSTLLRIDQSKLNMEVEIIQEDKNIDYVNTYVLCDSDFKEKGTFSYKSTEIIDKAFEEYSVAINKIIDKLEELK